MSHTKEEMVRAHKLAFGGDWADDERMMDATGIMECWSWSKLSTCQCCECSGGKADMRAAKFMLALDPPILPDGWTENEHWEGCYRRGWNGGGATAGNCAMEAHCDGTEVVVQCHFVEDAPEAAAAGHFQIGALLVAADAAIRESRGY